MRLRQIAFTARELEPAEKILTDVLGLKHIFRDEGVARYGLHNGVYPVGDNFLEIVAPTEENTAAGRFMDKMGGDAGYMVILQANDAGPARRRAKRVGIRAVREHDGDDLIATHFHPKDVGGIILSVDSFAAAPDAGEENAYWRWGGPDWESGIDRSITAEMTAVELRSANTTRQAAIWSSLLALPIDARIGGNDDWFNMRLPDGGAVRFRPTAEGQQPGIAAIDFRMNDKAEALRRAATHGLVADDDGFTLMQVRCNLT